MGPDKQFLLLLAGLGIVLSAVAWLLFRLIAGPNVYICDECVGICQVVLSEDSGPPEAPQPEPTAPAN